MLSDNSGRLNFPSYETLTTVTARLLVFVCDENAR
jgi:hypothetical protein